MTSTRVEALVAQLTLEEAVSLLAGDDIWHTMPIERLGIPRMRVSDGPAGVRGTRFGGVPSLNVPCGSSLAATWNPEIVRSIGELLGRELHHKGARVHLAPTVNLHRTPVGGRNFESLGEDPFLAAEMAVAYVRGVQSQGVASCIKHFVCNDTEFERMSIDSQVDERTMRELYLVPFERAVRDAGVLSVMTAYNKVNGLHAADHGWLINDVLRGEWGFDGVVMSDWYGLHSTVEGVVAGMDLEMPGPTRHRGHQLVAAVGDGRIDEGAVRRAAANLLSVMDRVGALDAEPGPETTNDAPADRALIRAASARGMVLLKNAGSAPVLPLVTKPGLRVAVIGPNAENCRALGGGSAHVTPTSISHPLAAVRTRLEPRGAVVGHEPGCDIAKRLPEPDPAMVANVTLDVFATPDELDDPTAIPIRTSHPRGMRILWSRDPGRRAGTGLAFGARLSFDFTPHLTAAWDFGIETVGPATLAVDGKVVIDNSGAPNGGSFFGTGRVEVQGSYELVAGTPHRVMIEVRRHADTSSLGGINVGIRAPMSADMVGDAVALAARSDVSIIVVGTNEDWESEGWDRTDIDLPGEQDRLITEVAQVSPSTIVVVNAGSPVAMPWLHDVDAVLFTWFGGQEMGDALVDVLTGDVEPQGRLPVTFPRHIGDTPAAEFHPGRGGIAPYREGRLVGYRHFDTTGREPLFPFGFGLGYADVAITDARLVDDHAVGVTLQNDDDRDGVQVVQVYAHLVGRTGLDGDEPDQKLVGFARVEVPAKSSVDAVVDLDDDAYRFWDVDAREWGRHTADMELRVGGSSRDIARRLLRRGSN
ncbi:MAG: glycoside hydrolase family 3 C-terminal domain-containing protein [Actinomycetota bacterium]